MINALSPFLDPAASSDKTHVKSNSLSVNDDDHNTKKLYLSARSIVSGDVGASIRSSSSDVFVNAPSHQGDPFDDFTNAIPDDPSLPGSGIEIPLPEAKCAHIHDWVVR